MSFRFPARWRERDHAPNPLSGALARRRAAGLPVLDLTVSNPTQCGLEFPKDWQGLLGAGAVRAYDPLPQGAREAREAIAAYYNERDGESGGKVDPDDLFLTAGTSEGYSHLFKLLCDPGDEALIPRPSYPLLETLAELAGVSLTAYELVAGESRPETGTPWRIDRASLEAALTPKIRLVFIVSPNNPTGSLLADDDAEYLLRLAEARGLSLIVDEVFADYTRGQTRASRLRSEGPLVFTLNGLSKLVALPQLKLAWIHVDGNAEAKARAREHLEWICDAYLSVGSAPQAAAPELLRRRAEFQDPVNRRLRANLRTLRELCAGSSRLQPLWPEGGWCLPLRCPGIPDDEAFAVDLLESEGILIQPGYFFDFEAENYAVISLLVEPDLFRVGVAGILRALS